ncbi:hypothetical protein BC833DRAFT_601770 [Globomyces pollinis-pini]|nr:hypothetical protein BC833DRAFT_601770 [Globomyces pollinis-pini]
MSAAQISPDCTVFAQLFPTIEGQPYTVAKCCTKQDPYVVCDNQKRITSIILKNVDVVGSLSSDLEKLDALTFIDISNNKITGSLPASIGKLSNLEKLYLNNNQLTGTIPEEFGKLQKLKEMYVY